jgi:glycosyltransferase involved in cell wall biosynthesis
LAGLSFRQTHLADLAQKLGTPLVYTTEYTLRTRLQIVAATAPDPLRRVRRAAWEVAQEIRRQRAVRRAAGLQCNGTPTYEAYRRLNANCHLYFDTRAGHKQVIDEERLRSRLAAQARGGVLRLVYSGRLDRMKGVHHLPRIANALRALGVRFSLDVFGDGPARAELGDALQQLALGELCRLRGTVDFSSELVPLLSGNADLFLCPHLQGDPSCTYLETQALGIPIVGYANEALSGMLKFGAAGCAVPLDDARGLARSIARWLESSSELTEQSLRARRFALQHTFERVFEGRVKHLRQNGRAARGGQSARIGVT